MVAFVRRFDRDYQDARSRITQNSIGAPIVIRAQGCERLDTSDAYKQYLHDSGGIFMDTVIHDIDLSLYLFGGDCVPKSVSAVGIAACHPQLPANGDRDNAVGVCEYWDGKIAFFYHSRTSAHGYDNTIEVFGTAGKISINIHPRANAVEVCDRDGFIKTPATPNWYERYAPAFVNEANQWVDAVLDKQPLPIPFESSLVSLKIATALQESLNTGRKIYFDQNGNREVEEMAKVERTPQDETAQAFGKPSIAGEVAKAPAPKVQEVCVNGVQDKVDGMPKVDQALKAEAMTNGIK